MRPWLKARMPLKPSGYSMILACVNASPSLRLGFAKLTLVPVI